MRDTRRDELSDVEVWCRWCKAPTHLEVSTRGKGRLCAFHGLRCPQCGTWHVMLRGTAQYAETQQEALDHMKGVGEHAEHYARVAWPLLFGPRWQQQIHKAITRRAIRRILRRGLRQVTLARPTHGRRVKKHTRECLASVRGDGGELVR